MAAALLTLAGVGPAEAAKCPKGQHWNAMGGGAGFCSPDGSGGGNGGSTSKDMGGAPKTPVPKAKEPPYVPTNTYTPPPLYVPPAFEKPKPAASATLKVGSTLKANKYGWAKGTVLKYRWLRNGVPIPGAWYATYKARSADKGKTVTVRVTGTKAGNKTFKIGQKYKIR